MEIILEQLGINFKLVGIQIFGFFLLYLMLKKFFFGRVMTMVQNRGNEIKSAYEKNEGTRNELDALKAEYEEKLREASQEAESIIQDATQKAEESSREIIEATRLEANEIKEKGIADLQQEKMRILSEVRSDVVDLSVQIASSVIEKSISQKEAENLTNDVIKKIGDLGS